MAQGETVVAPPRHGTGDGAFVGIVAVATVVGAVLGTITIGSRALWHDEWVSDWITDRSLWSHIYRSGGEANMWAYYSGLWVWRRLTGDSPGALRSLSLIYAVLSIPAIALLGRRLANRRVAVVAAVLCAVNPFMIRYAAEARGYSLMVFASIVSALCFSAGRVDGPHARRWRIGWVLASVVAYLAHQFGAFVIVAALLADVLCRGRVAVRTWAWPLVAVVVLSLPMVVASVIDAAGSSGSQFAWIPAPGLVDLRDAAEQFAGPAVVQVLLLTAVTLGVVLAVPRVVRRTARRFPEALLLGWLLLPVVIGFVVAPVRHVLVPRYLIACVPPALLLAAVAVDWLARRLTRSRPSPASATRVVAGALAAVLVAGSLWGAVEVLRRDPEPFAGTDRHSGEAAGARVPPQVRHRVCRLVRHRAERVVSRRPMKFSLSLPLLKDLSSSDPYRETYDLAVIAEECGFDTVTIGHHHFMPGNLADPLTFLATVAARTSTVRVGTGIFQLPIHNPVRVAEQVATIDELSGGRVSLGVGLGWWPLEYEVMGSDFATRGARMEEALTILKLVWTEEQTSFDGRFWSFPELTVHPRPVQQPHPPLWVAGVADTAVDRAARLGDAWVCGPVQSLAKAQSCLDVYRAGCARVGREPEWILRRYAWVGADRRHVMEDVLPAYVDGLMEHWRESVEDDVEKALFARIDAGEDVSLEEIAGDRLLYGAPDDAIAQIERYRALTGCDHVHAAFGAGLPANEGMASLGTFDEIAEMIRLFGREVIPAFD